MRLFLDECCPPQIARGLRDAGHDVLHTLEARRGLPDSEQASYAHFAERVVVTADYDFGELAFRDRLEFVGLVLLDPDLGDLAKNADVVVGQILDAVGRAPGHVLNISKDRVRERRLPGST